MKILDYFEISAVPIALMLYGFYLGQLHQSMLDLAGILMFITGIVGLTIAFIIHFFTRKQKWANNWYSNLFKGFLGCIIVFIGLVIYARVNG